jgi:dipeptidyl aminopeptidase/acylaminoacyl peptidase
MMFLIRTSLYFPLLVAALALNACSRERGTDAPPPTPGSANAPAQPLDPDPVIDRALLFGNPQRTQGRISPDGRHVSFIAPVDGVLNVWVAPIDDLEAAKPITQAAGRGIRQHFWAETGQHVLYLKDTGGDEDFHLHAVELATGKTRDLTPFEKTRAELIGTSSDRPDQVLIGLNNRDPRFHDPYLLDVASGKLTQLERNERFAGYVADNDLALRLAIEQRDDGGQDLLRKTPEGWTQFGVIPQADTLTTAIVGFDGANESAYMLDSRERDRAALVRISLEDGSHSIVYEDPNADVSNVLIDPATHEVLAAGANFERLDWHAIDPEVAPDLEKLSAALGPDWQPLASTDDGQRWIVVANRSDAPLTYYLYARGEQELAELFVTQPALNNQPLAPMTSHVIDSRDGKPLVAYLTLPRWTDPDVDAKPAKPLPLMLWVHGGPWARDEFGYDAYHQWFANRGYAVLSVNYRGSTGFGKAFVNAADREWAAKMHDDLIDTVDWALDQGITSEDRVAIGGGSYGGYATLVGLTFTPETFACGVDIVGPSNLETLLATIPPYWAPLFNEFANRIGDPRTEEGRQLLAERSPLTRVDRIVRPLLIGQGANDPRVKQAEADQIVTAMQAKKLPVTYVLYPDEGHGFGRPENSMAFNAIAENFLTTCLHGRAQPIDDALAGSSTTVPVGAAGVPGLADALEGFEPVVKK